MSSDSPLFTPSRQNSLPSSDSAGADEAVAKSEAQLKQWREDAHLDFTAYESSLIRIQFLLDANQQERERYAGEKMYIQDTAQAVRETNAQLREQLKEAQRVMEMRKGYDDLADEITNNKALKSRDEQRTAIEKLHAEIAELEREREEHSKTWANRREQFGRIVDEGMQMLRLIRDEKEEAERKEDMDEMDEEGEGSKPGTPRPGTPRATADGATPLQLGFDDVPGAGFQRVAEHALSTTPIQARGSRAASTIPDRKDASTNGSAISNGDMHTDIEEGEATEDNEEISEKMDTT